MLIVSLSGIRGVVGQDLTPVEVLDYAAKFGRFCDGGKVVVGTDTRPTGKTLKYAAITGLLATGCDVVDLGVLPTPTILLSVKDLGCKGGIVITASHNPLEWNGLKLINSQGIFLSREEADTMNAKTSGWRDWREQGQLTEDEEGLERHLQKILSLDYIDVAGLRKKRFKVVVDACNGAAYRAAPELLRRLGCEVTSLYCEPTPPFPRAPEPTPAGLTRLRKALVELNGDIGFATDPDADRLCIGAKSELPLGEEYTLGLCTDCVLRKERGTVVTNVSTSRLIDWIAEKHGGNVVRTAIGEAHVVRAMLGCGAVVGGEGNGGVILPKVHLTRDSLAAMALILQLLLERDESIEYIIGGYPHLRLVKEKVEVRGALDRGELRKIFSDAEMNETDGLLFTYPGSWISIRRSGTEPIVRIIAEAESEQKIQELIGKARDVLCAE